MKCNVRQEFFLLLEISQKVRCYMTTVLLQISLISTMARSKQTARKSTGGKRREVPSPTPTGSKKCRHSDRLKTKNKRSNASASTGGTRKRRRGSGSKCTHLCIACS